jgi:hypothetical protein
MAIRKRDKEEQSSQNNDQQKKIPEDISGLFLCAVVEVNISFGRFPLIYIYGIFGVNIVPAMPLPLRCICFVCDWSN